MKILMPLAEGFEGIEAVTVIDILRRADIEVVVAGQKGYRQPIRQSPMWRPVLDTLKIAW